METVLRLYYLRHGFDHFGSYVHHCLALLGFMALNQLSSLAQPSTPTCIKNDALLNSSSTNNNSSLGIDSGGALTALRSTLFLAAKGVHEQGHSYFVAKALLKTLRAQMPPAEQQMLGAIIGDAGAPEPGVAQQMRQVRSDLLPTATSFADDPEAHRLSHLVEELNVKEGIAEEEDEGEGDEGWDEP
jgi:hypothetical protein